MKAINVHDPESTRRVVLSLWAHSGLTAKELSDRSGLHPTILRRYARGDRGIGLDGLLRLLPVFDTKLSLHIPDRALLDVLEGRTDIDIKGYSYE